jgi:uncharacterized protein YutE (UPF0331/DUF86 family)
MFFLLTCSQSLNQVYIHRVLVQRADVRSHSVESTTMQKVNIVEYGLEIQIEHMMEVCYALLKMKNQATYILGLVFMGWRIIIERFT